MLATYLDSSALVKLVVNESESSALRRYLRRRRPVVSSALARTEVLRAVFLEGEEGMARARDALSSVELVRRSGWPSRRPPSHACGVPPRSAASTARSGS